MAKDTKPGEVKLRSFTDTSTIRDSIFNNVQKAIETKYPISNERYTLRLADVKYKNPKNYTNAEQKRALMRGQTLGWNILGNWELMDNTSGKVVDRSGQRLLAQVPYMTNRGTFIFNGSEYAIANQMRLRPGVYSRVKDNGIIEAHFNIKGGTGRSFRAYMEPETGVFRINVGQANLKLYPLLRAMGVEDRQLNDVWGADLLQANVAATDPRAVQRAFHKLVGTPVENEAMDKEASNKYSKSDVNYVMEGTFQQCARCANFNDNNSCGVVQGFISDTGWCVLWTVLQKFAKLAQEENRVRARFIGELVCDDSKPGEEWAYLKVHQGLPEAAYEALKAQDIECDPHYDKPHISVMRNWEAKQMIDKYGTKWKTACGNGRKFPFSLQNAIVDLDPEGWSEMDRVWFLEVKSPELRAHRKSLGFDELPHGDDSDEEFQFHITVAVHPKEKSRGDSKIASVFDDVEIKTAAAFITLAKQADDADVSSAELQDQQQAAISDLRDNPAYAQAETEKDTGILRKQKTMKPRYVAFEELKAMLPISPTDIIKKAYEQFVGRDQFYEEMEKSAVDREYGPGLRAVFERMELDPDTTNITLGKAVKNVSPELIVDVTKKLIAINRKETDTDDRDSLAFQQVFGPEDLFAERVSRDAGGVARKLLWKATNKGKVANFAAGLLSPQMRAVLLNSGLASPLEEVNPMEVYDQLVRVTRMGEGGMPSLDAIPDDARSVQPSHFGIIDPIRAPECYDSQTEVMTRAGWKLWQNVTADDEFACLLMGKLEYHKAEKLVVDDYSGTMCGARSGYIDYLVTPNHRMWIRPSDKKFSFLKMYHIVEASQASSRTCAFLCGGHSPIDTAGTSYVLPAIDVRDNSKRSIPVEIFDAPLSVRQQYMMALTNYDEIDDTWICNTVSKQLSDDLQLLAFQVGYAASFEFNSGMYTVHVRQASERVVYGKSNQCILGQFYETHYSGKIYCATVPGSLLYVRRNGSCGFWCGNSEKIGVDSRLAHRVLKGSDGNVYTSIRDVRSGKTRPVSANELVKSIVAFPGEMAGKTVEVRAMVRGKKLAYVKRKDVDFELPHTSQMFTGTSNLVPLVSAIKGGRLMMGAKYITQALPLRQGESPLVQNSYDDGTGRSFSNALGDFVGAVHAEAPGYVQEIDKNKIVVKYADGRKVTHDLYNEFGFNRKTLINNTPMVKIGDKVNKGQLLAKSNFTDDTGSLALGLNLRTAYVPYKGYNADDAIVISESAAKKLSSEHMFTTKYDESDNNEAGKNSFISLFPGRFDKNQLSNVGNNGVVRIGATVNKGDPLVLSVSKRKPSGGGMLRSRQTLYSDVAEVWEHESPGIVTDVDKTKDGWKIITKAYSPMIVGDKLSGFFGNKGVVSNIVPDDQMPHDKDGTALECLLNPLGIVSRTNPAQLIEAALGKVAKKTGKPYILPAFSDESYIDFAKRELQKNGLSDTEDLYDPTTGRKIPKVFTGFVYMMKLHHMAEHKSSGRDIGSYTAEGIPAGGGIEGSKRIGAGEMSALISHGATDVIRDAKLVRGQRNDDFWRALRLGYTPPSPTVPLVYDKFLSYLKGAGINLKKSGDTTHLFAMTDKDVDKLADGELTQAETIKGDTLEPIKGGLFDVGLTGGHGGNRWSKISLSEPMPNPVMEEPIRRMLDLTQQRLEDIISGKEKLNGETGTKAILAALSRIKVNDAIEQYSSQIRELTGAKRDNSIKVLGYLTTLKRSGQTPADLMVTKVPVLPPNFRPITSFNKLTMVSDPNYLYLDLMNTNDDIRELKKELGEEDIGNERLRLYNTYKALSGLGDPVAAKTKDRQVRGLLAHIFGSSPKLGSYQQRVLGAAVDTVGRGVITPNPSLNMDQVGIPEDKAWVLFRPFIMRNLIRRGMPAMAAAHAIDNKTESAHTALLDEMTQRPVIINRAPVLHKYGMMAAWAIPTKGHTLQIPPIVTPGFNADFDGDQMNYHLPVSKTAVDEAINKMMPSRNLLAASDFNVHYFPRQEFLHGLYLASTSAKKGNPKTFMTKEDVIKAYRRGELSVDDVVQFADKHR